MVKRTGPTNYQLKELLTQLESKALQSNFWARIMNDLNKPTRQRRTVNVYKIEKFAQNLANERNLQCKEIYFYTAPPYQSSNPNEEENRRKANYDKFIQKLKEVKPSIIVREGRCQKTKDDFQQKGVDTLLTMDLLKIAERRLTSSIILLTSDTDFVPIIRDLQNNYKHKNYLGLFYR